MIDLRCCYQAPGKRKPCGVKLDPTKLNRYCADHQGGESREEKTERQLEAEFIAAYYQDGEDEL